MKSETRSRREAEMSMEAYAGFLRLLLTPLSEVPKMTEDIEAYLRYANARSPVTSVGSLDTPVVERAA